LGFLIGGALAAAGSLTQAMFRNPLAAPGLVGVQAGAALGAAFMIVLGVRVAPGLDLAQWLPAGAFIGGLITTGLIYLIARSGQASTALATLLLTGIAVNALAGAATGFLIYLADDQQLRDLTFWTLGSLAGADWSAVSLAASLIGPILLGMPLLGKTLNVLALGEAQAAHLGVATEACKILGIVLVALSVGVSVAFAGMIGFIGLVVPHCARYLMGPDHRFLIPAAALLGAILLALADGLARTMVSPAELPIGILTSLLGGPFFLWLVIQRQRKESW
jgi:iron complex transport system permease protein